MPKARPSPPGTTEPGGERAITTDDVAQIFGVTVQAVRDWRHLQVGPAYFRTPGGQVRYTRSAVNAWIDAHRSRH